MSLTPPNEAGTSSPSLSKSVSFRTPSDAEDSASTTALLSTSDGLAPPKKRRSSIKEGAHMPIIPPKEYWSHPDPLIRRLRLRDSYGKNVSLQTEFRDAEVVAFLFGASWTGSLKDTYEAVEKFARKHPHRLKVVYCSVDSSERSYEANTRGKPWLSMEWDDGSAYVWLSLLISYQSHPTTIRAYSMSTDPSIPLPTLATLPSEPFLLASDEDLESEIHTTDPLGTLYLRPYSRVFLAEKFQVLGVPNLVVYHLGKKEVLTKRARIDTIMGPKGDETWAKWQKGERVEFTLGDLAHALRWTLGFGILAIGYGAAVRGGLVEDVVGQVSQTLTARYFGA